MLHSFAYEFDYSYSWKLPKYGSLQNLPFKDEDYNLMVDEWQVIYIYETAYSLVIVVNTKWEFLVKIIAANLMDSGERENVSHEKNAIKLFDAKQNLNINVSKAVTYWSG